MSWKTERQDRATNHTMAREVKPVGRKQAQRALNWCAARTSDQEEEKSRKMILLSFKNPHTQLYVHITETCPRSREKQTWTKTEQQRNIKQSAGQVKDLRKTIQEEEEKANGQEQEQTKMIATRRKKPIERGRRGWWTRWCTVTVTDEYNMLGIMENTVIMVNDFLDVVRVDDDAETDTLVKALHQDLSPLQVHRQQR